MKRNEWSFDGTEPHLASHFVYLLSVGFVNIESLHLASCTGHSESRYHWLCRSLTGLQPELPGLIVLLHSLMNWSSLLPSWSCQSFRKGTVKSQGPGEAPFFLWSKLIFTDIEASREADQCPRSRSGQSIVVSHLVRMHRPGTVTVRADVLQEYNVPLFAGDEGGIGVVS